MEGEDIEAKFRGITEGNNVYFEITGPAERVAADDRVRRFIRHGLSPDDVPRPPYDLAQLREIIAQEYCLGPNETIAALAFAEINAIHEMDNKLKDE